MYRLRPQKEEKTKGTSQGPDTKISKTRTRSCPHKNKKIHGTQQLQHNRKTRNERNAKRGKEPYKQTTRTHLRNPETMKNQ